MAHKKLDWIQFEIFKVQKNCTPCILGIWDEMADPNIRMIKKTNQSEFIASWTFELQEMLPKKCSLEKGKRQKSLMRTNGLMNWQCSTEQMLIFSGESKLHWESQFHSISYWQEEATTEAPSEAATRLPDFLFLNTIRPTVRCQETLFFLCFFWMSHPRMLSQMWNQSSWSRICHKGVPLPELFGRCRVRNRLLIRL